MSPVSDKYVSPVRAAVVMAAIGFIFVGYFATLSLAPQGWSGWYRLNREGVQAQGIVVSCHGVRTGKGMGWETNFTFIADEQSHWGFELGCRHRNGGAIDIAYVPSDPSIVASQRDLSKVRAYPFVVGVICGSFGVFGFLFARRKNQNSARLDLRTALAVQLLPRLRSMGFCVPSISFWNSLMYDFKFKREHGAVTHVLTVQLERSGLPRFVVGLSIEPEGVESLNRDGGGLLQARVQPHKGTTTRAWFRSDTPILQEKVLGKFSSSEADAVASCISLLPEVEAWWDAQAPSEHITVIKHALLGEHLANGA
jgi:hypothetical protein